MTTVASSIEERAKKASTALAIMLDYLGLDAAIRTETAEDKIALTVVSEDAGRIIGKKGKTLDDLQMLVNKMMQKSDDDTPRISVEVDGYAKRPPFRRRPSYSDRDRRSEDDLGNTEIDREGEAEGEGEGNRETDRGDRGDRYRGDRDRGGRGRDRREGGRSSRDRRPPRQSEGERGDRNGEFRRNDADHDNILRQQALDASKEVKKWGEPVTLPPMNSHDRRAIHMTLKDDLELSTESVESDNPSLKSVVICLKKP